MADRTVAGQLSPRQRQCLELIWRDQATSKEIAAALGIAKGTADKYIEEAIATLGARDRREAARLAFGPPPAVSGGDPAGVVPGGGAAASDAGETPLTRPWWTRWVPFRTGPHNDVSIAARFLWIVFLAVFGAIGFGALASGVHVLNDLVR